MPPELNRVVLRSSKIQAAAEFYALLGLEFRRHAHGNGPEHFASENAGLVFEIYPAVDGEPPTTSTRIGFKVEGVDALVERLAAAGARVVSVPKESSWGRRAVVTDLDGHRIELLGFQ